MKHFFIEIIIFLFLSAGSVFAEASVVKISAGVEHSLVLLDDGTVWAWGNNCCGQLGDGTNDNSAVPVQVVGVGGVGYLDDIIDISAGFYFSLALRSDGTVFAWGKNDYGQLGNGDTIDSATPIQVLDSSGMAALTGIKKISAGALHSAALSEDSTVLVWGANLHGELGIGTQDTFPHPFPVHTLGIDSVSVLNGILKISAGTEYNLALRFDGTVLSWGANGDGQLGNDTTTSRFVPDFVFSSDGIDTLRNVEEISACPLGVLFIYGHSLALLSDGTVWSFGRNDAGQLGINSTLPRRLPAQVLGQYGIGYIDDVVDIETGREFSVALKSDGTVWSWGENYFGNLGDGTTDDKLLPVQVHGVDDVGFLSDVVKISASQHHTIAIKSDGTLVAWGRNNCGQLGDGSFIDRYYPVQVVPIPLEIHSEENQKKPQDIFLKIFPNPFNSSCRMIVSAGADVKIYDLNGKIVWWKIQEKDEKSGAVAYDGLQSIVWSPEENIQSGIFIVKVSAGERSCTDKIVYLR